VKTRYVSPVTIKCPRCDRITSKSNMFSLGSWNGKPTKPICNICHDDLIEGREMKKNDKEFIN